MGLNDPLVFWAAAVTAVLLTGISKAGFGGGVGMLATPLMALTIPVADAAALMLPLLILCDLFSVWHYRSRFDRRSLALLLPGAVAGIAAGAFFFDYFTGNEAMLRAGIGALAVIFVLFQLWRRVLLGLFEGRRPADTMGVSLGILAGFSSTLVHAGGPPVALYLLPQRMPRDLFVGTTVIFFTTINLIKLIPYAGMHLLHGGHLPVIAGLAPLTFCGVRLGIYLNRRFSEVWFTRVVYAALLLTGIELITGESLIRRLLG